MATSIFALLLLALQAQALIHSPPRIIKQPPTDEMLFQVAQPGENDKPFEIECEAEGEPTPTYYWMKNGKEFKYAAYDDRISQQPGRGTLVITRPREEDLGQYQCFAQNEHGIATSNSVFVRKAELNSFKDGLPKTLTVNEGSPYKLQCQPPDGWPKPNVYWLIETSDGKGIKTINNSRMTLDPEGNLWFSNVTRQDASQDYYYACAASSLFRNEFKLGNRVILDVQQTGISPTQNRHPPVRQYVSRKSEVALRGKKIELFCIYGGTPLPQTVWKKNGRPIPWSDRIQQGNYGKSIIIKHTNLDDEGTYVCEASNGVGQADSYSINLRIMAVPYFTVEPEIQTAADDETIEFHCEASGIPEPTIKWIHNGKPIEEAPPNARRTIKTNSITIRQLRKDDTGNYGCNATNALGYVYKDVYVNVLAVAPEITEPPRREITVDQRTVTLTCRVFGAPKPKVKWIRNGIELTGGRYKVLENGDLEIREVTFSDVANYTCHAKNKYGEKEASGELKVKEHTKITEGPQDYEVAAGQSATFRCNAIADSSLDLEIEWLSDNEVIDVESQPRFVKTNDNSLTIAKTIELDSGTYTCVARTELDEARASADLIVQDVPNSPQLTGIKCNSLDATINWQPLGDNRSPILYYTIQHNTSFTPDTWEVSFDKVPSTDFTYTVPMSPWANYTFRVIAWNKIGPSIASGHSDFCVTQPDVPYKNPDNVEGKGTEPNNLVISWSPMPEIDHNAPSFHYRVYWKRDIEPEWNTKDVYDWREGRHVVHDQPTFQKYRIKVVALNEKGEANVAPREVIGYSGEDKPLQAPANFTVLQVTGSSTALLSWEKVPEDSVRGHFRGYKIQTWTENEGEENMREILVKGDSTKALVTKFIPDAVNYARVMVYNSRFNGPPSNLVEFRTPEGVPGSIAGLEATPLGSTGFHLTWKKPLQPNGQLTGFRIYYEEVDGTTLGERLERRTHINDPKTMKAKLAGLRPDTNYRIHVVATTRAGEGEDYYIERRTQPGLAIKPEEPHFETELLPTENGLANIKVRWLPSDSGRAGSHFSVKYREHGEGGSEKEDEELYEDYIIVRGLEPQKQYDFRVVAHDGDLSTESPIKVVDTYDIESPSYMPTDSTATAGWFIGMMLAIAFLILLLIIICIIKRNRGGKYDVHDREMANGRQDYPEEGGFHEYSQPVLRDFSLDNKSQGRQSLGSQKPGAAESDTDSMAEYGEENTGGQFTEDGSFIGQYVPGKPPVSPPQPIPHSASQSGSGAAAATYV